MGEPVHVAAEPRCPSLDLARPRLLAVGRVVHGYTWRLLREVASCGVDVRVVARDAPPEMAAQFAHETGPEGSVRALNSDRCSFREAVRFMRAGEATAVLALGGSANLPLLLAECASKRKGTPVILFTDANVPSRPVGAPRDWARHVLYRALRPLVAEAWTLGSSNEEALRAFGISAQRRLPLYATDFRALSSGPPARSGTPGGRIRLLCVARLSPEKNQRRSACSDPSLARTSAPCSPTPTRSSFRPGGNHGESRWSRPSASDCRSSRRRASDRP